MARLVKKRTPQSYRKDIDNLGRLRTAILIDRDLSADLVMEATKGVDSLIETLGRLKRRLEENAAQALSK